ncbi:hypothetical protein [Mucilaginibacter sp.]|uniref:hypothetical protein n=1 Tax=Mucilaginibacter sp. TaxID=1882438 RepID=UPI0025D7E0F8|nr:hypothetical protein [Mucilaginibacter sp.]
MKIFYLFISIVLANVCLGQNIKFQLRAIQSCNNVEDTILYYHLIEVGATHKFEPEELFSSVTKLTHFGKYRIFFNPPMQDTPIVNITDTGLTIYKYKEPNIIIGCCAGDASPVYTSCGKLADGFLEDFYPTGQVRQRGSFRKGQIHDTLVRYYKNGGINTRINAYTTKEQVEEFDTVGHKLRVTGYINPGSMYFYGCDTTLYYETGRAKLNKTITAEGFIYIDEYYPSGHLKALQGRNSRVDYFETGDKKAEYSWLADPEFRDDFDITKIVYDAKGHKTREIKYTFHEEFWHPFSLDVSKASFIESDIHYKNGKQISIIKDIDMDKDKAKYHEE